MDLDSVVHLLALAASLESEGQYNNAKLLRAAADSLLTRAAYAQKLPTDRPAALAETQRALSALAQMHASPALVEAVQRSYAALEQGKLPLYTDTPDTYMCRICGYLAFQTDLTCPECGADPATFKRFRPIYWLEALDPIQSLQYLRAMPSLVGDLLDRAPQVLDSQSPVPGGWSLRQAVSHLKDAQGVLDFRVNLILIEDDPVLESKAVFEWATDETARPATTREIFDAYSASRAQTIGRLENIALEDWWRSGRHEEFGTLKLYQQVSYFASHERTHIAQIKRLAALS